MRGSLMEFLDSRFKQLFVGRTWPEVKPPPGHDAAPSFAGTFDFFFFILLFCQNIEFSLLFFFSPLPIQEAFFFPSAGHAP